LREIAKNLYDADYLPFDNFVTLCAVLKRRTGKDFPLNEAAIVAEQLYNLWENKTK
jgi:hypothetical protein